MRRFFTEVVAPRALGGERYEVQMLYGVPRARLLAEIAAGLLSPRERAAPPVRLYVPFATAWDQATAYCRRRLRNNPNMMKYVLINLLQSLRGRNPGSASTASRDRAPPRGGGLAHSLIAPRGRIASRPVLRERHGVT
jgi:hypothetical protein